MTPADLQKLVDNTMARAKALMAKGEADYARGMLDINRQLERFLPEPTAAVAPTPPPPAPEPEPEPQPEKKILGVF